MTEFVLVKNNGIGNINGKTSGNLCLFISLGIIWRTVGKKDFDIHYSLFKEYLERDITPEEMVYYILKVKDSDHLAPVGETQIDTLIETFVKYTNIKVSVLLGEMKFDLFKEQEECEAIIVQYPNHFECAIPKSVLSFFLDK